VPSGRAYRRSDRARGNCQVADAVQQIVARERSQWSRKSASGVFRFPAGSMWRSTVVDDTESLDSLVNELNSSATRQSARSAALVEWLQTLRAEAGSDLYLVAGLPPSIRVDGAIKPLPSASLDSDDIEQQVLTMLPGKAAERYRVGGSADAS